MVSYGFWDNQLFGRNQIYLKLKLRALQFMPGIKNLNLIFFYKKKFEFQTEVAKIKKINKKKCNTLIFNFNLKIILKI
jgi:hypothetical protein